VKDFIKTYNAMLREIEKDKIKKKEGNNMREFEMMVDDGEGNFSPDFEERLEKTLRSIFGDKLESVELQDVEEDVEVEKEDIHAGIQSYGARLDSRVSNMSESELPPAYQGPLVSKYTKLNKMMEIAVCEIEKGEK